MENEKKYIVEYTKIVKVKKIFSENEVACLSVRLIFYYDFLAYVYFPFWL